MGYTHGTPNDAPVKICTGCKKELPNTNEYFVWADKEKGRLNASCKCCTSEANRKKNKEIKEKNKNLTLFYDGIRKCKHCGRELPNNKLYFSIDLTCVDGLRNVCRECSPKEAGFLDPNYKPQEKWTDDEIELLKEKYNHYTGKELVENFFKNRTIRSLESMASILGISGKTQECQDRKNKELSKTMSEMMMGRQMSQEWCDNISKAKKEYFKTHDGINKGKSLSELTRQKLREQRQKEGRWKGNKNPRHINPLNGSANGRWKGGILNTYIELRSDTKDWQQESMKFCGYHCVITNGEFDNIHHTTPFRDIVDECFNTTCLEIKEKVCDYSENDFSLLKNKLKELHIHYGFGACLCEQVHKLFHDNYGYTKFTPYDFLDFVYRIDCGEFDKWFKDNNLNIDINYKYIEYLESTLFNLKSA